ncbi:MFS transporter [Rubellimicrobium roseum]|uniref:MFS transporter n=1 Tax=Rubellimicrobium roseum TaxID=687525 RepID=A0A5C4NLA5_9RHOB|nr:MFS transporter [Rubellimicrobium roseum]TNC74168.1 MFS transporter [Rubellimicrobium roseum]
MTSAIASQAGTPVPGFASRLFASGALAFFLTGNLVSLYGVALPAWSETYALAEGQGGALLAAQGAGSFAAVLAGVFGLPLGQRAGLVALGLGTLGLALGPAWGLMLLAAAVAGAGFGFLCVAVNRAFLAGFGDRGPGMVGLVNAFFGLGAIGAPLLFLLAGESPGPVMGAIAALSVVALLLSPRDDAPLTRGLPDLRQKRLLVTLFIFWNGLIEGAITGFGASALIDARLSSEAAAQLTSGFFVTYLAARIALYWLAARIPPGPLFLFGLLGASACMAAAALGAPGLGFILAGAFVGVIFPAYYVWAIGVLGPDGRMTAAILTMALLGGTLGPILLRPILATTGEEGVFWIVSMVSLGVALSFATLKGRAQALAPA